MSPIMELTGLTRRFESRPSLGQRLGGLIGRPVENRAVHAVDNVDLTIRRGEALGLVGESGCGKSTLGRMIAGILPQSQGDVLFEGQPVMGGGARPLKTTTHVQMVFQDPFASLNPRFRIGDTIAEGPIHHGFVTRSEAPAYVARWLAAVGLPANAAERYPHQFSGGQRQRVAIARALAMKPDMLVCDEPVASLDVSIQAQIINLFLKLRRELNLTMLFISHDLSLVRHVCDRVAIMYLGRIVEVGTAAEIYDAPRHPYTRALLDSILKLTLSGEADFRPIAGELPSPLSPPAGCHFHLRCPHARDRCRTDKPALATGETGRGIACHFPLETAK